MPPDPRALATVARWKNGAIAAVGVLVGAWWCAHDLGRRATWLAALAAVVLTAYANAFNDLLDVDIDRRAHPRRPLPAGALTPRAVRAFAIVMAALGVLFASLARPSLGYLSVAVVALMTIYSLLLARLPLVGNIVVALLASLPFFYGAVTVGAARGGQALGPVP